MIINVLPPFFMVHSVYFSLKQTTVDVHWKKIESLIKQYPKITIFHLPSCERKGCHCGQQLFLCHHTADTSIHDLDCMM